MEHLAALLSSAAATEAAFLCSGDTVVCLIIPITWVDELDYPLEFGQAKTGDFQIGKAGKSGVS